MYRYLCSTTCPAPHIRSTGLRPYRYLCGATCPTLMSALPALPVPALHYMPNPCYRLYRPYRYTWAAVQRYSVGARLLIMDPIDRYKRYKGTLGVLTAFL